MELKEAFLEHEVTVGDAKFKVKEADYSEYVISTMKAVDVDGVKTIKADIVKAIKGYCRDNVTAWEGVTVKGNAVPCTKENIDKLSFIVKQQIYDKVLGLSQIEGETKNF